MSKKNKEIKTNVMRHLEKLGTDYIPHEYEHGDEAVDAGTVARMLVRRPEEIYKTLVTEDGHGRFVVGVVPAHLSLSLKKLAEVAGFKSLSMLKQDRLLEVTGYIRGGCSPIAMKKSYPTFVHIDALKLERIIVSAGKIGHQVEIAPEDLRKVTGCEFRDICMEQ